MNRKQILFIVPVIIAIAGYFSYRLIITHNPNPNFEVGQKLDSLNHVYVYYNGGVGHTGERHVGADGYNIGLTYQCVEFAKRYYYEFYKHKMPDSYGHAKDFFDSSLRDGALNIKRNLLQFTNPGNSKPQVGDFIIFGGHAGNPYGHVAIVSKVTDGQIEIIQQNPGPFASSRATFALNHRGNKFCIDHPGALGWLRMK